MSRAAIRLSRTSGFRIKPVSSQKFCISSQLRRTVIPYTQSCPSPTCECASTPPDLDIDRKTPLLNTMAAYSEQVILCTGKPDWHSNIEQDEGATGAFIKGLKSVIGKGGTGFDVGRFLLSFALATLDCVETTDDICSLSIMSL